MPLDVSNIKAKVAETPRVVRQASGNRGPNPFLDKTWDMGLWASFEQSTAFAADFKGAIEKVPARRGKPKERGELVDKVTGDAGDAVYFLREAAEKLGIGVAIRTTTDGVRNGYVKVTWYGKERKKYATGTDDEDQMLTDE